MIVDCEVDPFPLDFNGGLEGFDEVQVFTPEGFLDPDSLLTLSVLRVSKAGNLNHGVDGVIVCQVQPGCGLDEHLGIVKQLHVVRTRRASSCWPACRCRLASC